MLRGRRLHVSPLPDLAHEIIVGILLHNIFKAGRRLLVRCRRLIRVVELRIQLLAGVEAGAIGHRILLDVEYLLRLILRRLASLLFLLLNSSIGT